MLSFGLSLFHGHRSWLVCEVVLTDEPVEFENYRLNFMASGNLPIV